MKILRVAGMVVAVVVLLLAALVIFFDANQFKPTLESELSAALGRQVTVGTLRLSLLSGGVAAESLAIADDPSFSASPFVKAQALKVGVELRPLIFSRTLNITGLSLERPEIALLKNAAGEWNFSKIGGSSSGKPGGNPEPSEGVTMTVRKLTVSDGRLTIGRARDASTPQVYDGIQCEAENVSLTSRFPFQLTARLPGGGNLALTGQAGPVNPADASATPLDAKLTVQRLDLASSGVVDPAAGIAGKAEIDGTIVSDGKMLRAQGSLTVQKLQLAKSGSPAGVPVRMGFGVEHDLARRSGRLSGTALHAGKATADLSGGYAMPGARTTIDLRLLGRKMPVDELVQALPAFGVVLPRGSSLKGGTVDADLAFSGPVDNLITTGSLRVADSRLVGLNLASRMSVIARLAGINSSPDTVIQNLSSSLRVESGRTSVEGINLTVPSLGVLTGRGVVTSGNALDFRMLASVELSAKRAGPQTIPFLIQGTASDPTFLPDAKGMAVGALESIVGAEGSKGALGALDKLFKKKK